VYATVVAPVVAAAVVASPTLRYQPVLPQYQAADTVAQAPPASVARDDGAAQSGPPRAPGCDDDAASAVASIAGIDGQNQAQNQSPECGAAEETQAQLPPQYQGGETQYHSADTEAADDSPPEPAVVDPGAVSAPAQAADTPAAPAATVTREAPIGSRAKQRLTHPASPGTRAPFASAPRKAVVPPVIAPKRPLEQARTASIRQISRPEAHSAHRWAPPSDITAPSVAATQVSSAAAEPRAAASARSGARSRPRSATQRPEAPPGNGASSLGDTELAAGGAASGGFGLLAIPVLFLAFFVDAVLRATGVWSTPSAEHGRRPERPG
jgi:hypothetical protein